MQLNMLAFSIPIFVGLMALEYYAAGKKRSIIFHFGRTVANINVGIAERLLDTVVTGLFYFVYDYLHRHFALFNIQPSLLLWILLLLSMDFTWYWYHRLAHEVNIFWAAHVVHHQSEDFNYTVSARITVFQAFVRTGFWCILPIIGFPAPMIVTMLLIHGLYPFFIHTQLIGKLGILEYILVTPSHHRVHHASNPEYLDKNYGDVFIIWDKLFGTFKKEDVPIVYGLTLPLKSHSFLWQHFHFLLELYVAVRRTKGFFPKLRLIFGRPDGISSTIRNDVERQFSIATKDQRPPKLLQRYVFIQLIINLLILFVFILFVHQLTFYLELLCILVVLITLVNCGAILEQRRWIFYLEYTRMILLVMAGLIHYPSFFLALLIGIGILLTVYYFRYIEQKYLRLVYSSDYA